MQAGHSRNTAVLGSVAIGLALLVACVEVTKLSVKPLLQAGPAVGGHYRLLPSDTGPWTAQAQRESGGSCSIGIGTAADRGGDLYIVSRAPDGAVSAIWTGDGRSAKTGEDCGSGATVALDAISLDTLTSMFGPANLPIVSDPLGF